MALEITDSNIDEILDNNKITLVDFYASWCGPCRVLGPIVDKLAEENTDEDIAIMKLNTEENSESVSKYSIRNLPTILIFKEGKVVEKLIGLQSKEVLKEKLKNLSDEAELTSEN